MSQTHFKHPSRHLAPIHTTPVAQRSEDNSILSSTTSMIVCDVDLNLDGQEFAASRREQRDPDSRPRRRAAAHTTTFSTASTSGIQYGNSQQMLRQRAAGATVARTAHGTRSAHGTRAAHACSSVEAAARTTHATRSAHAICVMIGVHLAASTRPRHAGRRRAGRRRWARHRDCATRA